MPVRQGSGRASRRWAVLQLSGIGVLVGALTALGLIVSAGATGPSSGTIVSNAAQPVSPFTAGTPFASGQMINVVIPANDVFNQHVGVNIVECAAPDGVPPTQPSACDGNTIQGSTILPNADGSFTNTGYELYALPDNVSLGEGSGGVSCGLTAATECILYIGENQLDFTQPHYWSQPFFIAANATDNGSNAGDGSAPVAATVPDSSLSTAVASPTTVAADGVDQSTVTVTLLGTGSVPVAGKTVTLTPASGSATVSAPSPTETDANGQTKFTVTDTAAESVTFTAADPSDSVTLTQKPSVTFQAPAVDAGHSTVSVSNTNPPADGSTSTTITVTLRDQGSTPQPVAGKMVTLSGTGSTVITPTTPVVTSSAGVATFTATDAVAETVTFTATDSTDGVTVTNKASVTFGSLSVSPSTSTVTVTESTAPIGGIGTTVVVTLLSSSNSPVTGKTVSVTASSSSAVVSTPTPAVTGVDGKVSFQITDTVAEPVTVTATDETDGVTLSSQPTVTFQGGGAVSPDKSTVTAQATTAPANGETQIQIAVVLNDQFGHPVVGKTVGLTEPPTNNALHHPISTGVGGSDPGTTDTNGAVDFEVSDQVAEDVTFTATDTGDNPPVPLSTSVSITFTPGSIDTAGQGTTVVASPTNPPADGSSSTTITVTLGDHFSNPLSGKDVKLEALGGASTITTVSGTTDSAGHATFTATDSTQEIVTYRATDVTDGNLVLASEAVVKFGNPPTPAAVAGDCSVSAVPANVPADGSTTATVSVRLLDGNGGIAAGKTVTLTAAGGASKVTTVNGTSDTNGLATFTVSDSTAETVKYTANDTSDSLELSDDPVSVTFTAASATTTSTTSPTSSTTSTTAAASTSAAGSTGAGVTSPLASTSGSAGNTGGGGGTSLASTGSSTLLLWLAGLGALFIGIGSVGRRRLKGETRHEA